MAEAAARITIERLGARGDGLAADGLAVPGGLPGESVEVIREEGRTRLIAIATPSPDRIAPFCPHYARCGGCAVQHLAPDAYARWKRGIVAQALAQARIETELAPLVDAHGAGRRRITLHLRRIDGSLRAGLMEARSHALVPIDLCPITVPALHRAPAIAEALAGPLAGSGKPLDMLVTATRTGLDLDMRGHGPIDARARDALTGLADEHDLARLSLHGERVVERRAPILDSGGVPVSPPPGGFLQATEAGEAALVALARTAVPARAKRVLDLFSGIGPFALALARGHEVHAVEGEAGPLAALERAARGRTGLKQVTIERRDLFRRPLLGPELDRFDAVLFDPPRAGAQAQARMLAQSRVPLVIGVSCDPGTFARDAASLIAGGYRLERVTPLDQFRHSAHVELVGIFRREAARRSRR